MPLDEGHKRRVNLHYVVPLTASTVTTRVDKDAQLPMASTLPLPPRSLAAARRHRFAHQWKQAYIEELEKLDSFATFATVPRNSLPRNTFIPRAQVTFAYKENDDGQVIGFRARIVYPGNRLISGLHYDPKETATYAADRDSVRFVIAIASQCNHRLYHVDLKSAFLHERFKGKVPLYLQPLLNFDGSTTQPHANVVHMLAANLYGTPQACRVYINGAYAHLRKHGYKQCKSDSNVFTKKEKEGEIIMALTIDDFLVAASTPAVYRNLLRVLSLKYRISVTEPRTLVPLHAS